MTMNKKEQAEFAATKRQAMVNRALRWTDPVSADVPPPESFKENASGFLINSHTCAVMPAWSSSIFHGTGYASQEESRLKGRSSGSQGARHLYSTEVLALRALRNAVEIDAANKLADIDQRIANILAGEQ